MTTRFNYEEHAELVNSWGSKHQFPLPAKEFLPEYGLIVKDTAVGFVYMTDSKLAWLEWVFANPEKTPEERTEALNVLMNALEEFAVASGKRVIFSAAGTDAYRKVLERNDFKKTDSDITHYVKGIG